jgi:hypothetical protein
MFLVYSEFRKLFAFIIIFGEPPLVFTQQPKANLKNTVTKALLMYWQSAQQNKKFSLRFTFKV